MSSGWWQVRLAFRQVRSLLKAWMVGKVGENLPPRARAWLVARELAKVRRVQLKQQKQQQQPREEEEEKEAVEP